MQQELASVRARLHEAEEILHAIQAGEIDALAIRGNRGPQIHTLSGAEHPYRVLVETMSEGALTVAADGRILYCNPAFARLLDIPPEQISNAGIQRFVQAADQHLFDALLKHGLKGASKGEIGLTVGDTIVPVLMSLSPLNLANLECASIIVTDLREQKRNQDILASELLANSILDQAADAIVVCDQAGTVTRANQQARSLCGSNPLLLPFDDTFPLHVAAAADTGAAETPAPRRFAILEILRGSTCVGREVVFQGGDGAPRTRSMLLSAGPLRAADGRIIGCVASLTDITERKQAEQAQAALLVREQQARAEAQSANQAKDIFLATLSHELRTPLSAVLGWARLLRETPTPQMTQQAIEVIERNARVQAQLIDDILDISRIISGKIALEMRVFNLTPVVNVAIESVRLAAEAKDIRLEVALGSQVDMVLGDASRVQQVVWNLLSNATKFTPRGGTIAVHVGGSQDNVIVTVSDSGQGIPAEFLPFVFDRFRQADGSTARRHGGLGLGLAIVRHLVEMHGGSVTVASDGEGRGSTFTVQLPRAARAMPTVSPGHGYGRERKPTPIEVDVSLLRGVRVLVVEDQPDTLAFLTLALEQRGAQVTGADSAAAALAILAKETPDVLVSDIAMPGGDGYHLIAEQRAREAARHVRSGVPAIALTAFARTSDVEAALSSGFQRHLAKPVDITELTTLIIALVKSADAKA